MQEQLTKQELAAKIWEAANTLRSKIKAAEYKDYILGFMFYKFLSDKEENFLADNDATKKDIKDADDSLKTMIKNGIGYYIASEDLFSSWVENGINLTTKIVSEAIRRFDSNVKDDYKDVYGKIWVSKVFGGIVVFEQKPAQNRLKSFVWVFFIKSDRLLTLLVLY